MIPHIHTTQGITVVLFARSYNVSNDHPRFQEILDQLNSGAGEAEVLDTFQKTARIVRDVQLLSPRMSYSFGSVYFDGAPIHGYAVEKLIGLIEQNLPVAALVNFLERIAKNPSFRVVNDLYKFLEHGRMPLTEDGCFVAYKAIREDWTDIHSGKFNNSLGSEPRVQRNQVDEDPDRTCSNGLHVCSFDYLPHFAHADGRVVAVVVDPADVVAIPRDYNNTKMRCCGYRVVQEVTDYYQRKEDTLASSDFYDDRRYIAEYEDEECDWIQLGKYRDRDEAEDAANEHQAEYENDDVRVTLNGDVVFFAAGEE